MKLTLPFLRTYADHKPGPKPEILSLPVYPQNLVQFPPPHVYTTEHQHVLCVTVCQRAAGVTVICPRRASILRLNGTHRATYCLFPLHVP